MRRQEGAQTQPPAVVELEEMEKIVCLTTFAEEQAENASLAYWLSRAPQERIAYVERLRREYIASIRGKQDGVPQGLCRTLLLVERQWR